ncbi:MAG TPA: hypothetical protein VNJ02_06870 [Vicinamibacterales bacterium]|nr:hypothetical protein [Vicinamibacterales bacterium]
MENSERWPFRQDDPQWANELMWDRDQVIETHTRGNSASRRKARELLRKFKSGNTIGNEGCLLTSLAMVLRLLDQPDREPPWTPSVLNQRAHELLYYTKAGLSMAPLYADIVSEVTGGEVQLCAKEEYLSGKSSWPRNYASTCWIVRAYRLLPPEMRAHFAVMLKTGTYDDTVASHYVLLDPTRPGSPDENDAYLLDPAMPMNAEAAWRLSDSARQICKDAQIRRQWVTSPLFQ